MKVKELMSLLKKVDPEAEVNFEVRNSHAYRVTCAKLVLEDDGTNENDGDACLSNLEVSRIKQESFTYYDSEVNIHLVQSYYNDEYFKERLAEDRSDEKA